ncbi:MAG: patatin-like phospholipase family protein, partial [Candidatus Helarchaeota archaeon]
MLNKYFIFYLFYQLVVGLFNSYSSEIISIEPKAIGNKNPPIYWASTPLTRPTIAVVLSGGGARGIAHIGVLKALEKSKLPIDIIVGTSIGAVIGGLYASGYKADELIKLKKRINWNNLFNDTPARQNLFVSQNQNNADHFFQFRLKGFKPLIPTGYTAGQKLTSLLADLFMNARFHPLNDFDDLKVKFRAVSTDLITGKKIVHRQGNITEAVRASVSVPLFFTPVNIDSLMLVDGGLVDCIPVDVARDLGADIVVAIDMSGILRPRDQLSQPLVIADQILSIMMKIPNQLLLEKADLVVTPPVQNYMPADFSNFDQLVEIGQKAMEEKIDTLEELFYKKLKSKDTTKIMIDEVQLEGAEAFRDTLNSLLNLKGQKISEFQIKKKLIEVYNLGLFSSIKGKLVFDRKSNKNILKISFAENPIIKEIDIRGNTLFKSSELLKPVAELKNKYLNFKKLNQKLTILKEYYRKEGFSYMYIDSLVIKNGKLIITINEGLIDTIIIIGNQKTVPHVILREFPLHRGDIFNINQIRRGIDNIYSTGLFSYVNIEIKTNKKNLLSIIIKVKELENYIVRLGSRYDLTEWSTNFVEFLNDNTWGTGSKISFRIQYGKRRYGLRLSTRTDRIFKSYFSSQTDIFYWYHKYNFKLIDTNLWQQRILQKWGGVFYIGSQIQRLGNSSLGLKYLKIDQQENGEVLRDEIKGIIFRSIVDTRDQYPYPWQGKFYNLSLEAAQSLLTDFIYVKSFLNLESFYSYFNRITITPKIIIGLGDLNLPNTEK